jgi:hypothetical protein
MELPDERVDMPPADRQPARAFGAEQSDPDYVVVRTTRDVQRLSADILGERDRPIVGLTHGEDGLEPVLAASEVRALVGLGIRIYLVPDDELLAEFKQEVGPRLTLERAAVRVWWPGASVRCDPSDHPLVLALAGERSSDLLRELSQQLDLSRPYVREQITLLDDTRAFLEHELARMVARNREIHQRLRDAQVERHRMQTRAEAAEARLAALQREPGAS